MRKKIIKYYRIHDLGKIIFKIAVSRRFLTYEILGVLKAAKNFTSSYPVAKPYLFRIKAAIMPSIAIIRHSKPKKRCLRRREKDIFRNLTLGRAPPSGVRQKTIENRFLRIGRLTLIQNLIQRKF